MIEGGKVSGFVGGIQNIRRGRFSQFKRTGRIKPNQKQTWDKNMKNATFLNYLNLKL